MVEDGSNILVPGARELGVRRCPPAIPFLFLAERYKTHHLIKVADAKVTSRKLLWQCYGKKSNTQTVQRAGIKVAQPARVG